MHQRAYFCLNFYQSLARNSRSRLMVAPLTLNISTNSSTAILPFRVIKSRIWSFLSKGKVFFITDSLLSFLIILYHIWKFCQPPSRVWKIESKLRSKEIFRKNKRDIDYSTLNTLLNTRNYFTLWGICSGLKNSFGRVNPFEKGGIKKNYSMTLSFASTLPFLHLGPHLFGFSACWEGI